MLLKWVTRTYAATNNPNQIFNIYLFINVFYGTRRFLCDKKARAVCTYQLYCPAHVFLSIHSLLLCFSTVYLKLEIM